MENEATLTITTNHHARQLCSWNEVPAQIREDQFDYIDTGDSGEQYDLRFFRYRGYWYDTHEFTYIIGYGDARDGIRKAEGSAFRDWDGAQPQSYWDAILMKYARQWDGSLDPDAVVVAHASW